MEGWCWGQLTVARSDRLLRKGSMEGRDGVRVQIIPTLLGCLLNPNQEINMKITLSLG